MLRRGPTSITLTSADVDQYEETRKRRAREAQEQQAASQAFNYSEVAKGKGSNDGLKPTSKEKSKKDRIMGSGR